MELSCDRGEEKRLLPESQRWILVPSFPGSIRQNGRFRFRGRSEGCRTGRSLEGRMERGLEGAPATSTASCFPREPQTGWKGKRDAGSLAGTVVLVVVQVVVQVVVRSTEHGMYSCCASCSYLMYCNAVLPVIEEEDGTVKS